MILLHRRSIHYLYLRSCWMSTWLRGTHVYFMTSTYYGSLVCQWKDNFDKCIKELPHEKYLLPFCRNYKLSFSPAQWLTCCMWWSIDLPVSTTPASCWRSVSFSVIIKRLTSVVQWTAVWPTVQVFVASRERNRSWPVAFWSNLHWK